MNCYQTCVCLRVRVVDVVTQSRVCRTRNWAKMTVTPAPDGAIVGSVALLASLASLVVLCVCTKFRKRTKTEDDYGHQPVTAQLSSGTTILPVYGQSDDVVDGEN